MVVQKPNTFSAAYCREVIACAQDTALCPFLLCLRGQKPSVIPCDPQGLQQSDPACCSGWASGTLPPARPFAEQANLCLGTEMMSVMALLLGQGLPFLTPHLAVGGTVVTLPF